jgi:hypothetical protein
MPEENQSKVQSPTSQYKSCSPAMNLARAELLGLRVTNMRSMRLRLAISGLLAFGSGLFCWFLLNHFHQGAADFGWSIHEARNLLAGRNPYDNIGPGAIPYPMTAVVFALPLVSLPPTIAAGLFFGISTGLLAFGLTRHGYVRLLIFFAYPYWAAMITAQWTPLLMAAAFFPLALPVTLAKPQIGLPIALTHLTRKGVIGSVILVVLTFLIMPSWPIHWLPRLAGYQHFFPILVLPGPLLLLALFSYRQRDAQFLVLSSMMPQRWFYDAFPLWLIPKSRRELVYTVGLSWIVGILRWYHGPRNPQQVGRWTVLFMYLPMLIVLLLRWRKAKIVPHEIPPTS